MFSNVKIIEDKSKLQVIELTNANFLVGPIDIQTAEEWEHRLDIIRCPYVLAELEMTVPVESDPTGNEKKYARGYCLFVQGGEIGGNAS